MQREGIVHHGIDLQFDGRAPPHSADASSPAGGAIVIYGQTEVVKDLIAARIDERAAAPLRGHGRQRARLRERAAAHRFRARRRRRTSSSATSIAGCDGFHGVCRPAIPSGVLRTFSREYPFGWLGILAEVAPSSDELVYTHHERGFALLSLRSPTLSRLYIQCRPDEDVAEWPDDRIWEELQRAHRARRLDARRGAGAREGRHRHAQLRRRADAARAPLPRRRRGAHRPADRREGPQPRDRTTCACSPRRSTAWYRDGSRDALDAYSTTASAASGARSTSPGG